MNFEAITLEDCLIMHGFGYNTVIYNEGVYGFEKQKNSGSGHFYFCFSLKPTKRKCNGSRPAEDPRNLLLRARYNI